MKLDMGQAWNSATELLSKNKDVVLIVAGVFLFLPAFALALLVPGLDQTVANPEDADAMIAALSETYQTYWWAFILSAIANTLGTLTLLTLLTDSGRPTVAEALKLGAKGILPYLAAQILIVIVAALVIGFPLGLGIASKVAPLIAVLGFFAIIAFIYLMVKFSLITPVIAIDKIYNPIQVLKRSWALTKGNSIRLFAFFVLLFLAVIVIVLVVQGVLSVVLALVGGQVELIGMAIISSLANTIFAIVILAVLAGVHRQFAGPSAENVSDTFA
jgi:uncharacterized Tic20 family protein